MDKLIAVAKLLGTEGAKKLAGDMVSFLEKKVPRVYTDVTSKQKIDSGDAFEEYINKVRDGYSKSKTILYKDEEREISSFFEPPYLCKEKTRHRKSNRVSYIPSDNLEGIFNRSGNSKVLITGIGGMGKTILLKHLCVNAIETGYKIPVFISLRWFNDLVVREEPMEELIYARLRINGFKLDYNYFLYSLTGDKYVFLFDGYDEISAEKLSIITRKISDFTRKFSKNSFVIASRPVDQIYSWNEYHIFSLCPMRKKQVEALILKLDFDEITKEKFIDELNSRLYEDYDSFVSIPLTLSILFITYVANGTIPEMLKDFYEMAFDTLLYQHDLMKEGFERVLKSKLKRYEFRSVFTHFCFITYFKSRYSFSEASLIECISKAVHKIDSSVDVYSYKDDLVNVACMLVRDGLEYIFLHRNFQEYFAAYYVSRMLDERQKDFCSAYINTRACDQYWSTKEFLWVLRSIEPNKFDNIILLPILEKIYKTYLSCGSDLISTTATYCSVGKEGSNYGISYKKLNKNSVSDIEHSILDEFLYPGIYYGEALRVKEYVKDNLVRIKNECFNRDEYIEFHEVILSFNLSDDDDDEIVQNTDEGEVIQSYETIFYHIMLALKKFNELVPLRLGITNFDDMVDNY